MIDIAEQICQAIDKIVQERLSDIKYDTTVAATIVDNSHADQYYYTVSTGEAQFIAYSNDTSYKVDDSVLVTIPNNDYDQQKIIIGKNVNKDDNIPYILRSPFETLLDVTGNILLSTELKGLVANLDKPESSSIEIFNWSSETSNLSLDGYTRLGLKGQFSSWLDAYDLAFGEYGYELVITSIKKDINNKIEENITTTYKLNTYDMIGNPYRFNAYHTQEKVFDISDIGRIIGIQLKFYQVPGSFVDKQGNQLTYNQILGKDVQPDANLFTKDAYISFGYDLATFQNEDAKLYSISPETYNRTQTEDENKKYINLRWIHKFENGVIRSVTENDCKTITELKNVKIKWYRYKLGASSADGYSGVYWEEIKVNNYLFTYALSPDVTLAEEKIKVIIINNGTVVRSNIITFVNEDEVVNNATIDVLQGLNVIFEDGSNGNYFVYGQNNHLFNDYEGNRVRKLIPKLKEHNGELTELTEFTKLTWRIPANNTMLSIPNTQIKAGDNGYYTFTIYSSENPKQDSAVEYCIKPNLNATAINNVVYCELEKDGLIYTAAIEFNFGLMGTNGTDVTLVIDFEDPTQQAIWPYKTEIEVNENGTSQIIDAKTKFIAHLYDSEHNEIDFANNDLQLEFVWDLLNEKQIKVNDKIPLSESYVCEIANNIFEGYPFRVLRLTLKGWGDYDLIAYKPIALTTNEKYSYIGPSNIIYSTTGYIDYYKQPIKLYNENNNIGKQIAIWEVNPSSQSDATISKNNILQPSLIYIKNSNWYGIKIFNENEVYWYQPLVILQNLYPSAVINKWNEKSVELNENEGYIISPAIAAGKKNNNNQFSGVMLGDWSQTETASDLTKQTGLYGFHNGAVSFAFKEDGTAFIGKSGKGRIHFDGTNSTIRSQSWDNYKKGLFMDLDDGIVKLQSDDNYVLIWPRPKNIKEFNEMLKQEGGICYLQHKEYLQIDSGKAYNDELAYYLKDENGNYIPYDNTDIDWLHNYWNKQYTALVLKEHFDIYKQYVYIKVNEYEYLQVSSEDKYDEEKTYVISDNNAGKYFYFNYTYYDEINKPMSETDDFNQDNLYFRSEGGKKYITLSADTKDFPLAIGADAIESNRNFRVDWDGTCYITNGEIQGTINADYLNCSNGRIGGWYIEDDKLIGVGEKVILHANDGIQLNDTFITFKYTDGEQTGIGKVGLVEGYGVEDKGPSLECGEAKIMAGYAHTGFVFGDSYISMDNDGISIQGNVISFQDSPINNLTSINGATISENSFNGVTIQTISTTGQDSYTSITVDKINDTTINGTTINGIDLQYAYFA